MCLPPGEPSRASKDPRQCLRCQHTRRRPYLLRRTRALLSRQSSHETPMRSAGPGRLSTARSREDCLESLHGVIRGTSAAGAGTADTIATIRSSSTRATLRLPGAIGITADASMDTHSSWCTLAAAARPGSALATALAPHLALAAPSHQCTRSLCLLAQHRRASPSSNLRYSVPEYRQSYLRYRYRKNGH